MTSTIRTDLTGRALLLANRASLSYWTIRAGSRLARALPLRLTYPIATGIADLVFGAWRGVRHRTTENMRWVVGPTAEPGEAATLARAAFRNYFKYLVEFLRMPGMASSDIREATDLHGVEHLHRAMAGGKGVIAIGFHIGNIDLGAALLATLGYPVNVVVDSFEPPRLDQLIQRYREEKGLKLIPLASASRRVLRALRQNEILALLIDKPTPDDGVVVDFFGGKISIPAGAALLALKTGAPVLPCCVVRDGHGRFVGEIAAPVEPHSLRTGDDARDIQAITQRLVDVLESWVRRYPDQWYPFRRMWLNPSLGTES